MKVFFIRHNKNNCINRIKIVVINSLVEVTSVICIIQDNPSQTASWSVKRMVFDLTRYKQKQAYFDLLEKGQEISNKEFTFSLNEANKSNHLLTVSEKSESGDELLSKEDIIKKIKNFLASRYK